MDLENNQDFDLEDILKEFGEHPEAEEPAEPAGQMPELRFDDETPDIPEEVSEARPEETTAFALEEAAEPTAETEEPSLPDTQEFDPVEEVPAEAAAPAEE